MSETVDFVCILLFSFVVSAAVIESANETSNIEGDVVMKKTIAKQIVESK